MFGTGLVGVCILVPMIFRGCYIGGVCFLVQVVASEEGWKAGEPMKARKRASEGESGVDRSGWQVRASVEEEL